MLALPNANQFNKGGERDPSVLYDSGTYDLYFTALDSGGAESIGFSSTPEVGGTKQPNNASWSNPATQVLRRPASTVPRSAIRR